MTDGPRLIVADANVYVDAVVHDAAKVLGDPPSLAHIPSLPPRTVHPALHVIGVVRDGSDTGTGTLCHGADTCAARAEHPHLLDMPMSGCVGSGRRACAGTPTDRRRG